jgi:regulator of PEP synthase PpsR (kinase-PPPase family)
MKRTKENWLQGHPSDRTGISGLRKFDGEDLHYQERKKAMQETQRKWLEQQKEEKSLRNQQEIEEQNMYSLQILAFNKLRGAIESDLEAKKRKMQELTRDFNKKLEREKKERVQKEKIEKLKDEERDLEHQAIIRQSTPYINPLN